MEHYLRPLVGRKYSVGWFCLYGGGAESTNIFFDKVYAADITPPMDLYYRENSSQAQLLLES